VAGVCPPALGGDAGGTDSTHSASTGSIRRSADLMIPAASLAIRNSGTAIYLQPVATGVAYASFALDCPDLTG
jgi:hypothetical protein